MGGDHGVSVVIPAVGRAANALKGRGVRFLLHGDEHAIEQALAKVPHAVQLCTIQHADRVVAMDEKPAQALRRGKGTSLWNAIEAVKDGKAQAIVSSGNTGALMAMSKLILRMAAPGLDRPAIVVSWPTAKGATTVLDMGANVECDAQRLTEFAIMGAAYHRALNGAERPTVGLLNVGSEDEKGHEDVKGAHRILRETALDLDYRGFVEGTDISRGTVDVVVTDGFTGNVALKTAEGLAGFFISELKASLTSSLRNKIGAAIAAPALRALRDRLTPPGGGPLLGLNGIVVKSHGGADARGFAEAIGMAADLAQSGFADEIARNLKRLTVVVSDQTGAEAERASE